MFSTQTANGAQLIAYLTDDQAKWLDGELSKARIQFRMDRVEHGWTVFTNEQARPYLDQLFAPQQRGRWGCLLRPALVVSLGALLVYAVFRIGSSSQFKLLQFFGLHDNIVWASLIFLGTGFVWFGVHYARGKRVGRLSSALVMALAGMAAYLAWR